MAQSDETTKRKSTTRDRILLLLRQWPVWAALAALSNSIWEWIGPSSKNALLEVAIVYLIIHYAYILFVSRETVRKSVRIAVGIVLVLVIVLGACFSTHSFAEFISMQDEHARFWYRVDVILERNYKLYHSTYMPERTYATLKHLLGRPYCPELYDPGRLYTSIGVRMFHIGDAGYLEYQCVGDCYSNADSRVYFTFQGEANLPDYGKRIAAISYPSGQDLRPTVDAFSGVGENIACLGFFDLNPGRFGYTRSFCAPGSMGGKYEGFVLDFQNIAHPPTSVSLLLITDQKLSDLDVSRVIRGSTFTDWLLGRPVYKPAQGRAFVEITDNRLLNLYKKFIEGGDHPHSLNGKLCAWRGEIPCFGSNNAFVVSYLVDRKGS